MAEPAWRVGTSGFSYDEWRPAFYPDDLKKAAMLSFYAEHLPAVELNNTFYRMPGEKAVRTWRSQVPDSFRFAVKASQRITWTHKLRDCQQLVEYLFAVLEPLGDTLGCVFYQVPKWVRCELDVLAQFLAWQRRGVPIAFEFAHESWREAAVADLLHAHGATVVLSDRDELPPPELVPGAPWTYLRLRRQGYDDAELESWRGRVRAAGGSDAFVFFKHEDSCAGPALARRFLAS